MTKKSDLNIKPVWHFYHDLFLKVKSRVTTSNDKKDVKSSRN